LSLTILALVGVVWLQRRATIQAKLRAHDLLEHRVAERTRELVTANEQLALEINQRRLAELDLRHTQDELIHAGKLAALGHMSAAISHEISQPLAALRTYIASTIKLAQQNRRDLVIENMARMQGLLVRIADITMHLKRFARYDTAEQGECDVRNVVKNALELVNARIEGEGISVAVTQPDTPVLVAASGSRLEQVLVNLLANALDAMQCSKTRKIDVTIAASETDVALNIEDTGCGIPPEHQEMVFSPFFTTKDAGKGLGLGLSISHTIVKTFGGALNVEPAPSGGAKFTVALKAARRENSAPLEAAE
jgi:two-component system C4-dicarboxylate transport sensor histidine kinase DctB